MDSAMVSYAHECIAYLRRQIDPHDRVNPKYATLYRQIDAIYAALADVSATEIPPLLIPAEMVPTLGKNE